MRKNFPIIFVLCCIVLFFFLNLFSALQESLTYDEVIHIIEGENALTKHTFAIDTNNPPFIREMQTLPLVLGVNKLIPNKQPNMQALPARLVTIVIGMLLITGVYFLVNAFVGQREALLATFLISLEPTILGNSHYVTQDIGITALFFFSYAWILNNQQIKKQFYFVILGLLIGLGMAAKITYLPYIFLTVILFYLFKYKISLFMQLWKGKYFLGLTLLIALLVVWTTYFFKTNVIIQERKDATRISVRLLAYASSHHNTLLREVVMFGKNQQIPLGDYIGTLKNNALRSANGPVYYYIRLNDWYLMPLNLFLKIPLPLWILSASGFVFFLRKEKNKKKILWIFPVPLIGIGGSAFILHMHPFVRYILPIYPFLIILAGISWEFWQTTIVRKIIFAGLLMWYITGTLTAFPHFISYANEFAGYPQERYKLFMDSNLDWGQSLPDVTEYVKENHVGTLQFSYFGQDNGDLYGLKSDKAYGSYKLPDVCAFHTIHGSQRNTKSTLISLSNWYICGYNKQKEYKNPKGFVSDSFLVF